MRDIIGIELITPKQEQIANALLEPPHRVLVRSANNTGKTFLAGSLVNWFFDCWNPGICITTAPENRTVKDTCWKEVRVQRLKAIRRGIKLGGLRGDTGAEMRDGPDHYAKGYTIRTGEDTGFQGRHDLMLFFLFEECCKLHPVLWTTTRTMHKPELGHFWFGIFNPTDTTSHVMLEEEIEDLDGNPFWKIFTLDAFDHPNLIAELNDEAPPIPTAVTKRQVEDAIASWCDELPAEDRLPTDLAWPPLAVCERKGITPRWFRPGPEFQARVLGQWPDAGTGVWSPELWDGCFGPVPPFPLGKLPEIGCDCALGKGDDFHAVCARWGPVVLSLETSNTMDPARVFERLKRNAGNCAALANRHRGPNMRQIPPTEILMKLDDDGMGHTLASMLQKEGYNAVGVGAANLPYAPDRYRRRRDELWFQAAEKARRGEVNLALLDRRSRHRLKQQLLAPEWELMEGRRVVEQKDKTKEKIGRSPDDADALNLALYEGATFVPSPPIPNPTPGRSPGDGRESHGKRRGLFGR